MDQKELSYKIASGQVVFYRRVSTKHQAKSDFKHQMKLMKKAHPTFNVTRDGVLDLKETISGFSSPERRMAGKLGKALRHLKHEPNAIMIVTSADRICLLYTSPSPRD